MQLLIVSVCVNYLDYLSFCYEKNKNTLTKHHYYIITDSSDIATQEFCKKNNINCFITDEFYSNNSSFNKARAINQLFQQNFILNDNFEYILLLDSDCIIDNLTDPRASNIVELFNNLEDKNIQCLYSCGRRIYNTISEYNNKKFTQGMCHHIGFFQLFHKSQLFYNSKYLHEFRNASFYDCELSRSFTQKKCLPTDVDHIGPIYTNWDGRNPKSNSWT